MSTKGGVAARVYALCEPLAEELGLAVWDVQYQKEGSEWVLRIYIDKEGGVGIDDCVAMSHALDPVLDREDPEHFEAYMDEPVRVRLIRPLEEGTRELEGLLIGYEDGKLELQLDEETGVTLEKKELAWVCALDDIDL